MPTIVSFEMAMYFSDLMLDQIKFGNQIINQLDSYRKNEDIFRKLPETTVKSQSRIITQLPDQSIVKINRLFRGVADEHKTGLLWRSAKCCG
ncbi:MAG: hypothetical protein OXC84_09250 [Gammaproteobacteria bacterium]|nr:hypothetical protein [Gammaproteobacteria bacterium]